MSKSSMTPVKATPNGQPSKETLDLTRTEVRDLLLNSEAFRSLPPEKQQEIAKHTVEVAAYLAEPEGIKGNRLQPAARPPNDSTPLAVGQAAGGAALRSSTPREGQFVAQGAREGAAVAGALLEAVNFPTFVSGLIQGVFHAIVQASMEQMEAYGKLVADVAKTLNQFRDDNVSANQGRDHLVDQFPETFMLDIDTGADGGPAPRVRLREGADEQAALKKLNALPIEGGPMNSLDDESIEEKLVPAARTQLATSRQQLLATMVLMGINRIVVTDGRIAAKVLYDFQARDNFRFQRSATRFDYGDQYAVTREGEMESEVQGGERSRSRSQEGSESQDRDASYYTKGTYKTTAAPVLKLVSATQEATDAALTTKAQLAGSVEVNFKSDYFPLEKMADSFQIGRIQDAAKPGQATAAALPTSTPTTPAMPPATTKT